MARDATTTRLATGQTARAFWEVQGTPTDTMPTHTIETENGTLPAVEVDVTADNKWNPDMDTRVFRVTDTDALADIARHAAETVDKAISKGAGYDSGNWGRWVTFTDETDDMVTVTVTDWFLVTGDDDAERVTRILG